MNNDCDGSTALLGLFLALATAFCGYCIGRWNGIHATQVAAHDREERAMSIQRGIDQRIINRMRAQRDEANRALATDNLMVCTSLHIRNCNASE